MTTTTARFFGILPLLAPLALIGCKPNEASELRPSLTMFRIGEADEADYEDEEPVVVPEDHYLPGIVIAPEDYEYEDQDGRRRSNSGGAAKVDLSGAKVIDDPKALDKHLTDTLFAWGTVDGDLTDETEGEKSLNYDDVAQGSIGDCYMVAALSATLYADKTGDIRDGLIRKVEVDGKFSHFAVRFYDAWGAPQDVIIDAELLRKSGKPAYARSKDSTAAGEEWGISLVEKAYAQWHGGYQKIGDGGWAGDVMQAITGSTATYRTIKSLTDASIVSQISASVEAGRPVVAGTWGKDDGVDYTGTGIYAWHAYSVHGARDDAGTLKVQLRNPWGNTEPAGNGADDGIFEIDVATFRKLYQGLTFGGDARKDTKAPDGIKNLAVASVSGADWTLTFTATGDDGNKGLAAKYDVRVSDAPITAQNFYQATVVVTGDSPQAPGSQETVDLSDLDPSKKWFAAIRVEDESGNISPLSNVLELGDGGDEPGPTTDLLFDFEGGAEGFVTSGLFHRSNADSSSGSYSMWMGQDETYDYATGAQVIASLTSPVLDLSGLGSPSLAFESSLDVEADAAYDKAWVEVQEKLSNGSLSSPTTVWTKGQVGGGFELETASLSAFSGKKVVITFKFDSVDDSGNDGLGWFIDDVWVND